MNGRNGLSNVKPSITCGIGPDVESMGGNRNARRQLSASASIMS